MLEKRDCQERHAWYFCGRLISAGRAKTRAWERAYRGRTKDSQAICSAGRQKSVSLALNVEVACGGYNDHTFLWFGAEEDRNFQLEFILRQ